MGHTEDIAIPPKLGVFRPPPNILDDDDSDADVDMTDADKAIEDGAEETPESLVVAIDLGTTFSTVAYAKVCKNSKRELMNLSEVKCISNYPDDPVLMGADPRFGPQVSREDVPSELWYQTTGMEDVVSQVPPEAEVEDHQSEASASSSISRDSSPFESDYDDFDANPAAIPCERSGAKIIWGWTVQKELSRLGALTDDCDRLARFKLMLDTQRVETAVVRTKLGPILTRLKDLKIINADQDIIADFLEQLLRHAKSELVQLQVYDPQVPVEFVLCVPAVWPSQATVTMQAALIEAAQRCDFGLNSSGTLNDLFIVSEPEAAATCVLAEGRTQVQPGEHIVILDAGGGTVDATTYEVAKSFPLRFQSEVVKPATAMCGGSFVNEEYKDMLRHRLRHEHYLARGHRTINSIVDELVLQFENFAKTKMNPTLERFSPGEVRIHDLRSDRAKGFRPDHLILKKKDMAKVFQKSLDGTAGLLRKQLQDAADQDISVKKVMLVGGFGASPALRSFIKRYIEEHNHVHQENITDHTPSVGTTAIARGAVLRALNKVDGPDRVTNYSYGFLCTEHYEPDVRPEHRGQRARWDKTDGQKYIFNTVRWLIVAGDTLLNRQPFSFKMRHTMSVRKKQLICVEKLYMSDEKRKSHYPLNHIENSPGTFLAGEIIADMTFLRDEGRIKPKPTPPVPSRSRKKPRKPDDHYEIEFDLVMIVEGRSLRYEARWPPRDTIPPPPDANGHIPVDRRMYGDSPQAADAGQRVLASDTVCIAAAFRPGTA